MMTQGCQTNLTQVSEYKLDTKTMHLLMIVYMFCCTPRQARILITILLHQVQGSNASVRELWGRSLLEFIIFDQDEAETCKRSMHGLRPSTEPTSTTKI